MFSLSYNVQRMLIISSFLFLPLLLLAAFSFYPALYLVWLSFTSWDGYSPDKPWVGMANYKEIFENREIFGVLSHNLAYFIGGIVQNILALFFALLLSRRLRGRNAFRIVLFLPYILNSVAIAYMFTYVFDAQNGSLNVLLTALGLEGLITSWLGNKHVVNISLAFISMWKFMGFNMVIYIGALQSIPEDLYEASKIDGASRFQALRYITLPSIRRILELSMLLTVSGALEVFDLPFVMTKGGPAGASETFVTKTVQTAFNFNNYGLASAMGVVLLAIVVAVITIQRKVILRGEKE
ncbi:carbohydrate ABC transporter membrane protein 1 (CUT1 family) [Paenibacillus taihuensis]|uniref:Carbohydrate ABC transporter membrane protein 1 (CUT1 family) n=1 Tax=Paenibacillus taihuensis TaxID=1156355 RepID=A0A3D9S4M7_9BACL|nr:sugar ABC transporter permease [Paenibacillus taihuensis]REE85151.1 carbohydrate ABC transporter membrane protein 1 (CUT1 family) [Paenibacillus taihuensis]